MSIAVGSDGAGTETIVFSAVETGHAEFAAGPLGRLTADPFGARSGTTATADVDASAVAFEPEGIDITAGRSYRVEVTVKTDAPIGLYAGQISVEFTTPAAVVPASISVPLWVSIRRYDSAVMLSAKTETVSANRVRTDAPFFDPVLAWLFVDESATSDTLVLPVVNRAPVPLRLTASAVLVGDHRGDVVPLTKDGTFRAVGAGPSSASESIVIEPNGQANLALQIDRNQLAPDVYRGTLYLDDPEGSPVLSLPVSVTIREGPTLPALLILLGIILAYAAKWLVGTGLPLSKARKDLADDAAALTAAATDGLGPQFDLRDGDIQRIAGLLVGARTSIDEGSLAAAQAKLTKAEALLPLVTMLVHLRRNGLLSNDEATTRDIRVLLDTGRLHSAQARMAEIHRAWNHEDEKPVPLPGPTRASHLGTISRRLAVGAGVVVVVVALSAVVITPLSLMLPRPGGAAPSIAPSAAQPSTAGSGAPAPTGAQPPGSGAPETATPGSPSPRPPTPEPSLVPSGGPVQTPGPGSRAASGPSRGLLTLLVSVFALLAVVLPVVYLSRRRPREWTWANVVTVLEGPIRGSLLVALVFVGMRTLYSPVAAQVIAAPADFLGVFLLWGVASDVASRTLANFAAAKS